MIKILIILACFCCSPAVVLAQADYIDEIHLNDLTTYRGRVVEQKPGEYIRLILENRTDTLTFQMKDIAKLVRVPAREESTQADSKLEMKTTTNHSYNQNPFSLQILGTAGGGDISFGGLGIGIHYRLTDRISAGLETRYLGESGSSLKHSFQWQKIPVTLQMTYELQPHFNGRTALYAMAGIGYSFTLNGDYQDPETSEMREVSNGWCFNPGLGYRMNLTNNIGIALEVSYHMISDKIIDEDKNVLSRNSWDNFMFTGKLFF